MTNQLKSILFNIARLRPADQRWILRRLSRAELNTLNKHQGIKLLQNALTSTDLPIETTPEPIPVICQHLASKAPLYAAIVLEHGSYPWKNRFLETFDIGSEILNQVLDIKPLVKQAVVDEWESLMSFEDLLDNTHG